MDFSILKIIISLLIIFINSTKSYNTVLVIGAGSSGIAAATKLLENNIDVLILEAESRIGGRINSVHFGNAFVDMGAEWCHGNQGNAVYNLAKKYNILLEQNMNTKFVASDRRCISDEFSSELQEIFATIYKRNGNREVEEGNTLGEYFIKNLNIIAKEKYSNQSSKLNFTLMSSEAFAHDLLSVEGAFSWFQPSANSDIRETGGHFSNHWNGLGYKTILEIMMGKFAKSPNETTAFEIDNKILLNQRIENVTWNENGVILTSWDGVEYFGDHVIFTPSLGVLKNHHEEIFHPGLTVAKTRSIANLGYDGVMKIMLEFSKPWWPSRNFTGFTLVWDYAQRESVILEYPYGPNENGRSWLLDFYAMFPVPNNPNVLSLWFTGITIPKIEKTPDEIIVTGLMFVFEKFLGDRFNFTKPTNMLRSNWYTNRNFLGTYSYQTLEARTLKPSPNLILAKPLFDNNHSPRVLFAGEATHPKYYSTVHGAIETGYREAKRIIDYLNNKYPPRLWNMYKAVLQNKSRTNNMSEGWHNRFAVVVGKDHPCLYAFLAELQKEQGDTETMLREFDLGRKIKRTENLSSVKAEERIFNIVRDYETRKDEDEFIAKYLRVVGHNIQFGCTQL